MANTSSAKKAAKQNGKRRFKNMARKSAIKSAIKKVMVVVDAPSFDSQAADMLLRDVAAKLGRARGKHVLHANTASRKLSRLAKKINKRAQAA
jgi:small subunit ribosomal protein S20